MGIFRLVVIFLILLIEANGTIAADKVDDIHPINRVLLKLYPRKAGLPYPGVPRITAAEGLGVYRSGKAVIIWIAEDGGMVPGALHFSEMGFVKNLREGKLDFLKNRSVILYCN